MKAGKVQFHELPSLPNTQLASSRWVIPLQASGHQRVGSNPGRVWINFAAPQTEERCEGREGLTHEPLSLPNATQASSSWVIASRLAGTKRLVREPRLGRIDPVVYLPGWSIDARLSNMEHFKVNQIILKSAHVARGVYEGSVNDWFESDWLVVG